MKELPFAIQCLIGEALAQGYEIDAQGSERPLTPERTQELYRLAGRAKMSPTRQIGTPNRHGGGE